MNKACEKWVTACLSCQQVNNPRKLVEEWVDDQSKPEVEIDDEQQYEQELKNLRVGDQCHDSGRRPREQEIHKG